MWCALISTGIAGVLSSVIVEYIRTKMAYRRFTKAIKEWPGDDEYQ